MLNIILLIHLLGALITGILIFLGVGSILKNETEKFSFYSKSIGLIGGFDLISGSVLTIASSHQSAFIFCTRIALYVGIIAVTESVFYFKMRGISLFPKKALAYSSVISSFFIIAALVHTL